MHYIYIYISLVLYTSHYTMEFIYMKMLQDKLEKSTNFFFSFGAFPCFQKSFIILEIKTAYKRNISHFYMNVKNIFQVISIALISKGINLSWICNLFSNYTSRLFFLHYSKFRRFLSDN